MTRVLLACWPFEGHVHPQMAMALALRERGAEVAFYTDASMRGLIEAEGFELLPFERVAPVWRKVHGRDRGSGSWREGAKLMLEARDWIVGSIPDQVADLQDAVARWQPDVIGAEASMWGPLLVLSELGPVPVALVSPLIGAQIPSPARRPRVRELAAARVRRRIDGFRASHGLAPMGCTVNAYFGRLPLYLVHSVPELDGERDDLPPSVHYVGPCQWHPPEADGTAAWLDAIPRERPWVHVTEGTSRFQDHFLLRAAAEGLGGSPLEAILVTGRGLDAAEAGLAPAPNVHVTDWLSHDDLLPRCAAIVTTGGMGTVIAALRAGVPLVVVPTGWDKPANAKRVVDAGVGVRLSPRKCTPERLRAAVGEVYLDPSYRRNARRAAELLAAAPGPAGAAALIEGLASTSEARPHATAGRIAP